jgi:hypothetical protein
MVEIDEQEKIADEDKISCVPTIKFFDNSQEKKLVIGVN